MCCATAQASLAWASWASKSPSVMLAQRRPVVKGGFRAAIVKNQMDTTMDSGCISVLYRDRKEGEDSRLSVENEGMEKNMNATKGFRA